MPRYKVTMPNGKSYSIDGPAGATKEQVIAAIQRRIGAPEADETTFGGQLKELAKGVIPGAAGLLETGAAGVGALLPEEQEKALRAKATELATAAREEFKPAPGYEQSWGRQLGEGLGSTVPFFALGPFGTVGRVAGAGLGMAAGAGEARQRAEQEGGEENKGMATLGGAAVGATEILPVFGFISRLPTSTKSALLGRVQHALITAGEEGAQEAAQQIGQNLIARGLYKPDQSLIESAGEEGAYGAATGAFIQVLTDMALGHRAHVAENKPRTGEEKLADPEPPPVAPPGTAAAAQEEAAKTDKIEADLMQALDEEQEQKRQQEDTRKAWEEELTKGFDEEDRQRQYYADVLETARQPTTGRQTAIPTPEEGTAAERRAYTRQTLREAAEAERLAPEDREGMELEVPQLTEAPAVEAPKPPGTVRVYHSGSAGEGDSGRWVSTDRTYAEDYRPDLPLFYTDIPANDPRLQGAWPDQGVEHGFTFNFELTPKEATNLKPIERSQEAPDAKPVEAPAVEAPAVEAPAVEAPEAPEYTMRDAALDVMRQSGKTNVDTLRNSLAIPLQEAKSLRQQLIDEGVLVRKGNTYILQEVAPVKAEEVESATPRAGDIEATDVGAVGRGDVLPPSRPVPEGSVSAEPAVTPVERTRELIKPAVGGEGVVEPALEEVEAAQQPQRAASLRKAALDYIRSTGKAGAVNLQQALGISLSEARSLREALIGSGAITPIQGKKNAYSVFEETTTATPQAPFRAAREGETAVEGDVETRPAPPTEPLVPKPAPKQVVEREEPVAPKVKRKPMSKEELIAALRRAGAELEAEEVAKSLPPEAAAQQSLDLVGGVAKPKLTAVENKLLDKIKAAAVSLHADRKMSVDDIERYNAEIVKPRPDIKKLKKLVDKVSSREEVSEEDAEREETFYGDQDQYEMDEEGAGFFDVGGPEDFKPLRFQRTTPGAGMDVARVTDIVNKTAANWKNKPRITVVQSFEDLPENIKSRIPSDAAGVYYSGDVYVIANRAVNEASVRGTLFHESLGHYGIRSLFGRRLGEVLTSIYRTNPAMRKAADKWLKVNPDTYAEETHETQVALAIEEILAEASEQGVIKDPGIRAAFNRVAAMIRQFLRAMGIQVNYSNNDIRQILIQAHDTVVTKSRQQRFGTAETVAAQRKQEEEHLTNIFDSEMTLPKYNNQIGDGVRSWLGNAKDNLREFALGLMSIGQQAEVWEKELPALKDLEKVLEERGSSEMSRREEVSTNVTNWFDVSNKYKDQPGVLDRFFKVANMTTVYQVDPLEASAQAVLNKPVKDMTPFDKVTYDIVKEYNNQPADLRQAYKEMREYYDSKAAEFEKMLEQRLGKEVFDRIKAKYDQKKLKVYLPLWRDGSYWLSYTDRNGETITSAHASDIDRRRVAEAAKSEGAKDFRAFERLRDARKGAPPTGFVGEILKSLDGLNVSDDVKDAIYETYLNYLPAESVRQLRRSRASVYDEATGVDRYGVFGFEPDIFQAYANVAPRIANQLTNLEYAIPLDEKMSELKEQTGGLRPTNPVHAAVYRNIEKQVNNIRNPPNTLASRIMDRTGAFSYFWYIAGNISSAIINTTQLPLVVAPLLGGKYGITKTTAALDRAMSTYLNGGWDSNNGGKNKFPSDYTFGAADNLPAKYKKLYDAAVSRSVIRRSTGYELNEAKKTGVEDYTGTMAKVKHGLGWVFQNSERFNREVTLLAAFDLAYEKSGNVDEAIEEALKLTKEAHGSALSETGPRLFQQGFGKVMFTFKRFAQAQVYLISKLFKQAFSDADPNVKRIAGKQLLGIYGAAFLLAGLQGVPGYGLVEFLANLIMGDDDEPYDLGGSLNELSRKGLVNQMFGVDVASRTGFNSLLWREDPSRMAEVGPAMYAMEQAMGPAYGAYLSASRGVDALKEGHYNRFFEAISPSFMRNGLKALRYAEEGVTNKDGVPIVKDLKARNLMMQAIGFTPTKVAEARESAGVDYRIKEKLLQRRQALIDQYYAAWREKDAKGKAAAWAAIKRFSTKNPQQGLRITPDTLSRSILEHRRRELQSVQGLYMPMQVRKRVEQIREKKD
jgi:hypothetical protein